MVFLNRRGEQVALESFSSCTGVQLKAPVKLQVKNYLSRETVPPQKRVRKLPLEEGMGLYHQAGKTKKASRKPQ